MASTNKDRPLGDIPDAFLALLQAQSKWGQQLYADFTGSKAPTADSLTNAWQAAANAWQSAAKQLPGASAVARAATPACTVPPPCWMPRSLGECTSYVSNCSTATVRLVVTNADRVQRGFQVRSDGPDGITVSPESATISPMNRATFEVSMRIPEGSDAGKQSETLIWLDGCNQHYLRWTVIVGSAAFDSCHEVGVSDAPDYRHHWYDHFYCVGPCNPSRVGPNG